MEERIKQELALLRQRFPELEYNEEGKWIRIPNYILTDGWNRSCTDVVFQIPIGYPGTPPYGIYTLSGILFDNTMPNAYSDQAPNQPPFPGNWGIFSWSLSDGQWRPTADPIAGSNLLNWVIGFRERFKEGR